MEGEVARDRDRDAEMDRLLRAAMSDGPAGSADACPAADELSAYVEQTLARPEREALEPHLASCERCQQALAMMATMPEPAAIPANAPARTPSWWLAGWRRWLVPATALASAAIIYVALKPAAVLQPNLSPDSIVATAPAESPTPPEAPGTSQLLPGKAVPSAAQLAEAASPRAKREEGNEEEKEAVNETPRVLARTRDKAVADRPEAKLEAAPFRADEAEAGQSATLAPVPQLAAAPVAAPPSQPPPSAEPEAMAEAQAHTAQPRAAGGALGVRPTRLKAGEAAAPRVAAPTGSKAAADAALAAPEQVVSTARGEGSQAAIVKGAGARPLLWRLDPGARIFGSADAGRTWQLQYTGAGRLVAGSSPSPEVCWVVGGRGLVLRTTDGRTWHAVPFPERLDLVAVLADSDRRATVHASDGRRFTTDDGGATWRE